MSDFDSPWKEALTAYFQPFLALFLPRAHAAIDWRRQQVSRKIGSLGGQFATLELAGIVDPGGLRRISLPPECASSAGKPTFRARPKQALQTVPQLAYDCRLAPSQPLSARAEGPDPDGVLWRGSLTWHSCGRIFLEGRLDVIWAGNARIDR
jgi:hypothetical protein